MPNPKVKFNREGERCSKNEKTLRRLPECGIFFIDDKPFDPDTHEPFNPDVPKFTIDKLKNTIAKPVFPRPLFPNTNNIDYDKGVIKVGDIWVPEALPQDDNHISLFNRRHMTEGTPEGYTSIKTNNNPRAPRGIQDYEPVLQRSQSGISSVPSSSNTELTNLAGEVDDGAGVGFGLRRRIVPLGNQEMLDFGNLDSEFGRVAPKIRRTMSSEDALNIGKKAIQELKITDTVKQEEKVLAEVKKTLKKGNKLLSQKEVDGIVKRMGAFSIDKSTVKTILNDNKLFNEDIELIPLEDRAFARQLAGNREEILDTNFKPTVKKVTSFDIETIREDTPLADRTGIRKGRPSFKKIIDQKAGRLPEELRTIYSKGSKATTDVLSNLTERSADLVKDINATKTRILGQKYNKITPADIEMGLPPNTTPLSNITTDVDGFQDILLPRRQFVQDSEFAPLSQEYSEGFSTKPTPKLRVSGNLTEAGVGFSGAGAGMIAGIGMSKFLSEQGIDGYGNAAISGGFGGAIGTTTAKVTEDILIKTGARAGSRLTMQTLAKSAIKGGGIGAVFSVALLPVDVMLNSTFLNAGMNHAQANVASGGIAGGTAFVGTVAVTALAFGAETLGLSIVVGAVALLASELYAWYDGARIDREQKELAQQALKIKTDKHEVSINRTILMGNYLSEANMDFDKAVKMFHNLNPGKSLGERDYGWATFKNQMTSMFNPDSANEIRNPTDVMHEEADTMIKGMVDVILGQYMIDHDNDKYQKQLKEIYKIRDDHLADYNTNHGAPSNDSKYGNSLIERYISHSLANDANFCKDGNCPQLKANDTGELTPDEIAWLDNYTNETWKDGANLQIQVNKSSITYTRNRVATAQTYLLEQWNDKHLAPEDLDPKYLADAMIDPTFKERFYDAITKDAQQIIIKDYYDNQTKIGQLPSNLTKIANLDTDFDEMIHHLYTETETLSSQLKITIPQLVEIQRADESDQTKVYEKITFNNSKESPDFVEKALEIYHANTLVKADGFYDIDQAKMDLDPTSIKSWTPSNSQILQAHQSGMNLIDYQNYMIELSKGDEGDFSKIPVYDETVTRATGITDFQHFQEELNVAGYNPDLYMYNKDSLEIYRVKDWIDNTQILKKNNHVDKYLPENIIKNQENYAEYITGINLQNQERVNAYNHELLTALKAKYKNTTTNPFTEYNKQLLNYEFLPTRPPTQTEEATVESVEPETVTAEPVTVADAV